ncbi:MAG: hypothetical protein HY647_02325 [Acidobacteria bacterium]|nr:hypothetical protein [Acidobacteriota bacterium]
MGYSKAVRVAKFVAILLFIPALILARRSGPPAGVSGAPGEQTCWQASCHLTATGTFLPNSPQLTLTVEGGSTYVPGEGPKRWTVTLDDPLGSVFGFQLSARVESNNAQAGSLTPLAGDALVVLCSDGAVKGAQGCRPEANVEYIEHGEPRTQSSFSFDWTPPTTNVGNIKVYVAVNAANNSFDPSGDRIHTANFTLTPQTEGSAPIISQGGVVNAWSFKNLIGDATWISIFGSNLAPTTRQWRSDEIVDGNLPTSLDGVSVKVNNHDAYIYFISPGQINALTPKDGAAWPVPVQVTTPNGTSNIVMVEKKVTAPALFTWAGLAPEAERFVGAVAAQPKPDSTVDYIAPPGLGLTTRAARPGETVLMFATGCEPTTPSWPAGQVVTQPFPTVDSPVSIRIGGIPAQVAGDTGFLVFAGGCQFNVTIPTAAPNGNLPVVLDIGGVSTQTTQPDINIPVQNPLQATFTDIQVSYRLDPWLIGGSYGGGFWVSPPVLGPATQGGSTFTLETRAVGLNAQGQPIAISPMWIPDDPAMVTVSPNQGNLVTITVQRAGQSSLRVTSQGVSKELVIQGTYQGNALYVEIAQSQ